MTERDEIDCLCIIAKANKASCGMHEALAAIAFGDGQEKVAAWAIREGVRHRKWIKSWFEAATGKDFLSFRRDHKEEL